MNSYAKAFIMFVATGFSCGASAKSTFLDFMAQGDRQRARMDAGVEAIDSASPLSSVRIIEIEEKVGKRGQFLIVAFNASNTPTNFGTENITVSIDDSTPMPVVTYERLLKEEKNRQMWAAIAAGMSAAGNSLAASQAGYTSGVANYNATTTSPYGTFNTYGTGTYSSYNSSAAYAAQATANAQNNELFARLAANNAASLEALKANLRTTTLDPGNSYGGMVTFDVPSKARKPKAPVPVRIIVDVAGEKHEFVGSLVRK